MSPQADETLAAPVDPDISAPPLPPRPPTAGDRIGRYVVLERLGAGGMGIVFAAYDPELDRRVAVKLMRHDRGPGSDGSGGREHLMSEARALAKLAHPNVIGVHDVGLHEGGVFVAMEFIDGRTLTEWATEQNRTADEVLRVYREAGAGLAAAHVEGIVHRDFKPDNVMLDRNGRVRVLDFGLARAPVGSMADSDIASLSIHDPLTMGLAGTPAYMAPEQLAGDPIDARADQFSFCVALYESLFGERPFQGDTVAALAWATLEEDPAMPSGAGVPAPVLDALIRGLAKSPSRRFPSMRELLLALDPPRASPHKRRAVAGATILGAGVLAWTLATANEGPTDPCAATPTLWSADIEDRFAHAATGPGSATITNTADALRTAAATITSHRRATCSDRVAQRLTEDEHDRRMLCLDRRAHAWTVAVDYLLEHPDITRVRGSDVVPTLPSADRCLDPRASDLPETEGGPRSHRVARLHALESNLDAAHVLIMAGESDRSRTLIEQVVREASEESLPWAESRARFLRANYGANVDAKPDFDVAQEYRRAFTTALRANRQSVLSHASIVLADHYGTTADADTARMWLDIAQAVAERGGLDDAERSHLARVRGAVALAEGDLEQALAGADEALEYCRRRGRDDVLACALEQADRGERLVNLGRFDEATAVFADLVAAYAAAGDSNVPHALDIRRRYVFALAGAGELDQAVAEGRRTLADAEAYWGRGSPQAIPTMSEVSVVLATAGEHETALELANRVVDATERDAAGNPYIISFALHRRGTIRGRAGQWEDGLADLERALELRSAILEADHPSLRMLEAQLGDALLVLGRPEAALPHLHAAAERCVSTPCSAELAGAPLAHAEALAMLGRHEDARRILSDAGATRPELYNPWATWCDLLLAPNEPTREALQSIATAASATPELALHAPGFTARLHARLDPDR